MNNPMAVLLDEHETIVSAEKIIAGLDKKWETDENTYSETVKQLLLFFREYSDGFHHRKEEDILFKELRNHSDFRAQEILDELEQHHEAFRETVKEIQSSLEARNWKQTQILLTRYIDDLLNHIAVENDELFITAESVFSENELQRIYFLFQDMDSGLGISRKEELVEKLRSLIP